MFTFSSHDNPSFSHICVPSAGLLLDVIALPPFLPWDKRTGVTMTAKTLRKSPLSPSRFQVYKYEWYVHIKLCIHTNSTRKFAHGACGTVKHNIHVFPNIQCHFILTAEDMQGKTEEEIEMMKLMGFGSFDTTKVSTQGVFMLCCHRVEQFITNLLWTASMTNTIHAHCCYCCQFVYVFKD